MEGKKQLRNRCREEIAILILKPILGVAAPTVLQHPKLVF